jgi:hypothetical protein
MPLYPVSPLSAFSFPVWPPRRPQSCVGKFTLPSLDDTRARGTKEREDEKPETGNLRPEIEDSKPKH